MGRAVTEESVEYGQVIVKMSRALGLREASGLVRIDDGSFLVVDDERGIFHCTCDGKSVQLDAGKELVDLEGIAITPDGMSVCVLSEEDGGVWRYRVDGSSLHGGEQLGVLPQLSKKKNRGWEGIAFAAAGTLDTGSVLLAAHQAKPRRVGLFDADTLEQGALLRLPKDARKAIGELNDIAVGANGRILLLSGKSGRIAEMRLESGTLVLVRVYCIETSKQDVPEGISVDAEDSVWICTDGKGMLRQLELKPTHFDSD